MIFLSVERPKRVQMRTLRKQDVSGDIGKPLLIGHGTLDFVVSTSESVGYKELVEKVLGPDLAAQLLRVYLLAGVGHNPIVLQTAFLNAAIDAVDTWVETGTPPGALPGATLQQPAVERDDDKDKDDRYNREHCERL